MSDLLEILADVKNEGTDPFIDLEKEIPSDSPTEKEPKVEEPAEGDNTPESLDDNVPFHKHPRWIERENELKTLREERETMSQDLEDLKSFREETSQKLEQSGIEIPDWFTELYGDNEIAWQKYQQHEIAREAEIEEKILTRQNQQQQNEVAESDHWNKWVDDGIKELEGQGHKFDRNELIKTMLEYRPTDSNNNLDFEAGIKIHEALKDKVSDSAHSNARKNIADITTKSSGSGQKLKDYMTSADLRNTSWNQL